MGTDPPAPAEPWPYRPDADDAWPLAEPAVPAASVGLAADQARDLILLTDENDVALVPACPVLRRGPPPTGPPPGVLDAPSGPAGGVYVNALLDPFADPRGTAPHPHPRVPAPPLRAPLNASGTRSAPKRRPPPGS